MNCDSSDEILDFWEWWHCCGRAMPIGEYVTGEPSAYAIAKAAWSAAIVHAKAHINIVLSEPE